MQHISQLAFASLLLLAPRTGFACSDLTPQVGQDAIAPAVASAGTPVTPPEARPVVELAICLDISGSMDGLIDSA